jgi:NitT/TauT family transport system permease protein
MNTVVAQPKIEALGGGFANTLNVSWSLDRPVIPAPHQVVVEVWNTVFTIAPWKVKSLVYHVWVTLSSTLLGFVLGTLLGIGLAVAIVHFKLLSKSLMPWIIASQTIPILAIAPMVIVVLGSVGLTGLVPKSVISMYLCFFPVAIGMVKGLTSPDPMQLVSCGLTMRAFRRCCGSSGFRGDAVSVASLSGGAIALTGRLLANCQRAVRHWFTYVGWFLLWQTIQIWSALVAASGWPRAGLWCGRG